MARLLRLDGDFGFRFPWPTSYARFADCWVRRLVRPFAGGFRGTPALRALDRPMAMACFVERAPCFPSRM